jgi:hypothetical protein
MEAISPRPDALAADSVAASTKSAVSWPAIIAGAFVAISASLILLSLGSGLGFASISPWADHGVSAGAFAASTAIWLIVTQWISAGLGGYIAGRLRTRWHGTHTHEIFFRDTAHGLVTWAVATVVVAALVGASVRSMMVGGAHALSGAASASAQVGAWPRGSSVAPYGVDKLLRPSKTTDSGQSAGDRKAEAEHIMAHALATGSLPDADRQYLAEVIAATTGISMADAQIRVVDWLSKSTEAEAVAKVEADAARIAAAEASIYTALALLIGAFIASVSAALGGRLRDEHP